MDLAFGIIDRLLGGPGVGGISGRELTEIEREVIEGVLAVILAELSKAWSTVAEVDFQLEKMESHPQFVQIAYSSEIILAVSLEMEVGTCSGMINLCFPFNSIKEILSELDTGKWLSMRLRGEENEGLTMKRELSSIYVPLSVELGGAKIRLADLSKLSPGQVIRLDKRVDDKVLVKIDEIPAFYGWPGTSKGRMAVRLSSRVEAELK